MAENRKYEDIKTVKNPLLRQNLLLDEFSGINFIVPAVSENPKSEIYGTNEGTGPHQLEAKSDVPLESQQFTDIPLDETGSPEETTPANPPTPQHKPDETSLSFGLSSILPSFVPRLVPQTFINNAAGGDRKAQQETPSNAFKAVSNQETFVPELIPPPASSNPPSRPSSVLNKFPGPPPPLSAGSTPASQSPQLGGSLPSTSPAPSVAPPPPVSSVNRIGNKNPYALNRAHNNLSAASFPTFANPTSYFVPSPAPETSTADASSQQPTAAEQPILASNDGQAQGNAPPFPPSSAILSSSSASSSSTSNSAFTPLLASGTALDQGSNVAPGAPLHLYSPNDFATSKVTSQPIQPEVSRSVSNINPVDNASIYPPKTSTPLQSVPPQVEPPKSSPVLTSQPPHIAPPSIGPPPLTGAPKSGSANPYTLKKKQPISTTPQANLFTPIFDNPAQTSDASSPFVPLSGPQVSQATVHPFVNNQYSTTSENVLQESNQQETQQGSNLESIPFVNSFTSAISNFIAPNRQSPNKSSESLVYPSVPDYSTPPFSSSVHTVPKSLSSVVTNFSTVSATHPPASVTHPPVATNFFVAHPPASAAHPPASVTHSPIAANVFAAHPPASVAHPPASAAFPPASVIHPPVATNFSAAQPPASAAYPPVTTNFSAAQPPASVAHSPASTAHPPASTAHPPASTAHPPASATHPPVTTNFSAAHSPASVAHPPPSAAHPPASAAHPSASTAHSPVTTNFSAAHPPASITHLPVTTNFSTVSASHPPASSTPSATPVCPPASKFFSSVSSNTVDFGEGRQGRQHSSSETFQFTRPFPYSSTDINSNPSLRPIAPLSSFSEANNNFFIEPAAFNQVDNTVCVSAYSGSITSVGPGLGLPQQNTGNVSSQSVAPSAPVLENQLTSENVLNNNVTGNQIEENNIGSPVSNIFWPPAVEADKQVLRGPPEPLVGAQQSLGQTTAQQTVNYQNAPPQASEPSLTGSNPVIPSIPTFNYFSNPQNVFQPPVSQPLPKKPVSELPSSSFFKPIEGPSTFQSPVQGQYSLTSDTLHSVPPVSSFSLPPQSSVLPGNPPDVNPKSAEPALFQESNYVTSGTVDGENLDQVPREGTIPFYNPENVHLKREGAGNNYRLKKDLKKPTYAPVPDLGLTEKKSFPDHTSPTNASVSSLEEMAAIEAQGFQNQRESPTSSQRASSPRNSSITETYYTDLLHPPSYRPPYHHWFFKTGRKKKSPWTPFSMADSLNLEQVYTSSELNENTKVHTDGGRYDVEIIRRKKMSVYWDEPPGEVRRCSWFVKNPSDSRYSPYDENIAALLEDEYKMGCETNEWNRRIELADGEVIILHSPSAMAHHVRSSSPDVWGSQPIQPKPRVVKRGVEDFYIPKGEPKQVDHLLLMVHGVGKACDLRFRSLVEVVDDFRSIALQLVSSHFRSGVENGNVGRVEILPVEWHGALHTETVNERLSRITLPSIPRAREFTNETILDILFYTSPVFAEKIVQAVGVELNRVYNLFKSRNPGFSGQISLGGHSLGSLILFDILSHQTPQRPHLSTQTSLQSDEDEAVDELGCLQQAKAKLSRRMSYLTIGPGTGQPYTIYPQLIFQPKTFFALGSPIGMFVTVRGLEGLGEEFKFPTCPAFFNIFHPNDPVAYRIEALIKPEMAEVPAILIPHHKGRKRMHLELKETMAHVTAALKQKLVDSMKSTWNAVFQLAMFNKKHPALQGEVNQVIEDQVMQDLENDPPLSLVGEEGSGTDVRVGKLNGGRRIDYVLQEAPLETFNQYISAVSSHLVYWESEDTTLMILKEIYGSMGISPDSQVPQPILPFDIGGDSESSDYTLSVGLTPTQYVRK